MPLPSDLPVLHVRDSKTSFPQVVRHCKEKGILIQIMHYKISCFNTKMSYLDDEEFKEDDVDVEEDDAELDLIDTDLDEPLIDDDLVDDELANELKSDDDML